MPGVFFRKSDKKNYVFHEEKKTLTKNNFRPIFLCLWDPKLTKDAKTYQLQYLFLDFIQVIYFFFFSFL